MQNRKFHHGSEEYRVTVLSENHEFVWRQSEFAFFGAVTSVAALFYLLMERKEKMEEKILIKSKMNQSVKRILGFTPLISFGLACLFSLLLAVPHTEVSKWGSYTYTGWDHVFDINGVYTKYFIMFVLGSLCLITAIITGIIYLATRQCELEITDSNVKGKTLYGKEVVLPLYMVSSYSTRSFLSVVAIATASGITKFSLIENYNEIGVVLSKLINQRQINTQVNTPAPSTSNSMDDLVKLKNLLDSGIITQEEFEAKKKQLLEL